MEITVKAADGRSYTRPSVKARVHWTTEARWAVGHHHFVTVLPAGTVVDVLLVNRATNLEQAIADAARRFDRVPIALNGCVQVTGRESLAEVAS